MADIKTVYSEALSCGLLDRNVSEERFTQMMGNAQERKAYFDYVRQNHNAFYGDNYERFSAAADKMLGLSTPKQTERSQAGSVGTNPRVEDYPAPTNETEYEANMLNQNWGENDFLAARKGVSAQPLEKYSDEALRLRREQILGNAERKKQQSISEQENWEKTHPFLAALSGVSHAGAMPIQSQKEKMQETPDAMYTGEHNAQLQAIEDELGRRAKDTVIPQAIESTLQSEEWTAKVRENSRDMSLHQRNNIGAAEYLNTKANEILNAGSKFDDSNAIANWAEGLKNDLFDRDISGIMSAQRAGRINNIVTKLNSGEELTEDEAVLLNAYINLAAATEARQFDLSTAYQIGQGTAQSVPFMVDMMISHGLSTVGKYGIIKVLAKTGSKHIGVATKWLQVPDKIVASAVKSAGKELGEDIFGAAGKKTAKDFARKAAYEGIATPLQTIAMPSSWEMMLDEAAQTKLQTSKSELSFLDKARIFTNAAQETLTERAGGELIDWGLGRAFGAATKPWHFGGKGQNAITKYIQSPIGETAEEYIGALLNLVRSYNPLYDEESNQQLREGAKEMFTAEGLGKTFGTVLPMSLVGGAVNMGELRVRTREMDKAREEIIRQLTSFCGASEEEAQQIMAYTEGASTAKEFAERLDIVGTHLYNAYENMGYDMEKRDEKGEREGMGATLRQSLNDYAEQAAKMNGIVEQFSDRYANLSAEEKAQAKQALEDVREQNARRNMLILAGNMASEEVGQIVNRGNNYLYNVAFADGSLQEGDEAFVVGGNVAVTHRENGEPLFDTDASESQVVEVRINHADGTSDVRQVALRELNLLQEPVTAAEWLNERTNGIYQDMLAQRDAAQQEQQGQQAQTSAQVTPQQQSNTTAATPIATYRKDGKEISVVSEKNGVATLSEPISVGENESIHVPTSMLDGLMQQLGYEKNAAAQNQPQSISGTPLSTEQADAMIGQMEQSAEQAPQLELTPENWISQFGEDGIVETPIGKVKMGENQFIKLFSKKRGEYFGMIRPTLNNPDVILEETDPKDGAERDSKYLFIKSFVKSDGSRIIHFESVTVRKDGLEVSISSHELNDTAVKNKMQNDKILHLNEKLSLSSEWRLTKTPGNEERPDLVPTSDISSERKGTENNPNTQENPQKNVPFAENLAAAPRDKMGRVDYRAIKTSDELAKVVTAEMKGNKDDAKDFITMKKKAAEKAKKSLKHKSNEDSAAFLEVRKKEKELQALVSMWDNALTSLRTIRTAEEQAAYDAEQAQKQAAREARKQVQAGTSDGSMASRYASAPKIDGNAGTITAANGQVLKGHYVLVSADGLTPSHDARNGFEMTAGYPTVDGHSINDRDYKNDPEEQAKVRQVAQQYNGNAIKNMPIVSDEGLVYNGNGRIMAGQLAAQQGTDGAYRQALEDNAAQFGFTAAQVASVPNARVVFQTEERLPYNTTTLAMFNATEQQAQSNTSKAAANTRKLTPEAVGHIINAISGFENTDAFFTDKKAPFNLIDLLIKDGILSDRDKAALIDGNRLSGAGKDMLTAMLFGTAFDEQTIRLLADNAQVQNSVMRALPQIIENKGLGELSLFDHINNAIAAIYDMREKGMSFYEYTHQTDIYGATAKDNFSAFELLLADEMMSSGVSAFRDVLTLYNERARQVAGGQTDLLGETTTYEQIANEIVEHYKNKDNEQQAQQSSRQGNAATQPVAAITQGSEGTWQADAPNAHTTYQEQLDSQGNPIDTNGDLIVEEVESVYDITDEDFDSPSRNVALPAIPNNIASALGINERPVIIKKNIFEKNRDTHEELSPEDSRAILINALYNTNLYGQSKPVSRPSYRVAIQIGDDKNSVVVIDVYQNKDKVEIVGWRYINEKGLERLKKQVKREDGHLLILSPSSGLAAALSALPSNDVSSLNGKSAHIRKATLPPASDTAIQGDQLTTPVGDKEIYNRHTTAKQSTETAEASRAGEQSGTQQTPSMNAPISEIPAGKGTKKSATDQIKSQKNAENLQNASENGEKAGKERHTDADLRHERERIIRQETEKDGPEYTEELVDFNEESDLYMEAETILNELMGGKGDVMSAEYEEWYKAHSDKGYGIPSLRSIIDEIERQQAALGGEQPRSATATQARRAKSSVEDVDAQFNRELQQQIEGTLPKGHIYQLGMPSETLQSAGVPNLPIELAAERLAKKSRQANHPFDLSEVSGLVDAVQNPIALFNSSTQKNSAVILTELRHGDSRYVVVMRVKRGAKNIEINSIRSIYPKDSMRAIAGWVNAGQLVYADKAKLNGILTQSPNQIADKEAAEELNSAAKVVKNFENPKLLEGKSEKSEKKAEKLKYSPKELYLLEERFEEQQKQMRSIREQITQLIGGISREHYQQADPEKRAEADRLKAEYDKIAKSMSHNDMVALTVHLWKGMQHVQKQINETTDEAVKERLYKELDYNSKLHTTASKMLRDFYGDENIYPTVVTKDGGVRLRVGGAERSAMTEEQQAAYDVVNGMLADAGVPVEVLTDEQMTQLAEMAGVKTESGTETIEAANNRFNEELERYERGGMKTNEYLSVGTPLGVMRMFMPDIPIIIRQHVLSKASVSKHNVELSALKDLPSYISNPIFVFQRDNNTLGILTEMKDRDGKNICVAIELGTTIKDGGTYLEVNDIRSIHGRDAENIILPIVHNNTLRYVDKEKGLSWLSSASSNYQQEIDKKDFNSAAKVVQNFDTTKSFSEKSAKDAEKHTHETARLMTVYHGSGANFDHFDHRHMGEGEGAQAFGWGTYVTEVEGIGRMYAETSAAGVVGFASSNRFSYKPEHEARLFLENALLDKRIKNFDTARQKAIKYCQDALRSARKDTNSHFHNEFVHLYQSALARLKTISERDYLNPTYRNLYTVDIPEDNGSNYLHWEGVISNKVIDRITSKLEKEFGEDVAWRANLKYYQAGNRLYQKLTNALGNDKAASEFLSRAGFVGISYPAEYNSGGRKDGKRNYVIFKESDAKITNHIQFLQTPNGVVYGAAVGGKIYLNGSHLNPNTPIHEYTHLWDDMVRKENPELWKRGVELLKQTSLWDEVKNDPNYANIRDNEDEIASEVHSLLSGEDGERLLNEMVARAQQDGTRSDVAKAVNLKECIKKWLREMWSNLKGTFEKWTDRDLSNLTAEQFAQMPLRDLARGINPNGRALSREEQAIKDAAKKDGTYMKAPNGKPTNLTEKQWLQVRTRAFKKWFGDWQAKHEAYVEMPNRLAQWLSPENIKKAQGKSREDIIREFGNEPQAIAFIPTQFLQYVDVNLTDNRVYSGMGYFIDHAVNHHPKIAAEKYRHIQEVLNAPDEVKAITDNGNNSIVFIKQIDRYNAVVIEVEKTDDGRIIWHKSFYDQTKKPYANKGTRLYESSSEGGVSPIIRTDESAHDSSLSVLDDDAKVQQKNETTKSFGNFLRPDADFSQIVDENGEPMVVYHGTRADFSIFDRKKNNPTLDGFYFTDREELAKKFAGPKGRVGSYFLNVRNPERNGFDGSGANMKKSEYRDGGIFIKQQTDRYAEKGTKEIIVFSPNQIKSATDNAGTFSTENDDIRFSIIGEKGASGIDKSEEVSTRIDNLRVARQMEHEGKDERAIRISDNLTEAQQLALDAVMAALDNAGVEVDVVSEETARAEIEKGESDDNVRLMLQIMEQGTLGLSYHPIAGAKLQKNLQTTKENYKKLANSTKNAISDIAKALGAHNTGTSNYITIEAKNGKIFTLRISNHNATVANFDNNEEETGISIVISRHENHGIINNGNAYVVEFFYPQIALTRAEGTPIADIIGALEQTLYSGEYTDPTGLAERQEVNIPAILLQTQDGTVYGYAKDGKIHLTHKGLNPNTPIHEYAHLWAKAMQRNNPQGWQSAVERLKGTPMWEEVANDPRYQSLSNEDAIASEVLARYSGKRGAERMAKMAKQMLDRAETRSEVAKTVSLIQRVKKALQDFWKWVGENLFDIKQFSSAEEVADRVLYDLMNGTDIKQQSDSSVRLMLQIMEQGTKGQSNYPIAGAKLQKNLETTKEKYKNIGISTENAITDIAKTLGARNTGTSNYVTIEAKNGKIFTLRISNHNATVSNFDNNGEDNGISIVISRHDNNGITNNGNAHVVEFFYSDKALNKAEGTPIADIIGALEQTMYSGEYKDPTGLAQVQEVNIPADTQTEYSRIQPNETLGEYAHRIAEARRKEQDGERAEFSMSDAPTPDPDETRIDYVARFNMWYNEQRKEEAERDYVQAMQEARRKTERALQVVADRYRPLQKFQEYILSQGGTIRRSEQDADGNLIRTSADAYQDTTLATGRAGYQIQRFASHQLKDMVNAVAAIINSHRLDDIDIRWNNVDTYFTDKKNAKNGTRLTARELVGIYAQAKDCQEAIEQELPDRGKDGFLRNLQDVNGNPVSHTEVIRLVEGALEQEQIDNLWQSINAATQFSLDYQLRNGMIDQATYDQFHRNYYVPERGWRERDLDGREDGYTEGRGTQLNGNPYNAALKKARGRDSIASDPFAYIQSIAETTILSTERNNVKQKFLQMLLDNEEIGMKSGAWKIRRAYVVRVTDSNGEAHEVVTYERPKDESTIVTSVVPETMIAQRTRDERLQHRVAVMRNGQQYIIELQDEALANALNSNFKEAQWLSNSFANVMRKGVRYMSAINTQYNPAFAIWNLARDLQIGIVNNAAKESGAFQARFLKNIAAVQPVIMQYVWNDHMKGDENFGKNEELSRYLQEYFESGAQTGFSYMQDVQTLSKEFDKLVKGDSKAKRALEATTDFMSMATELSELTVRFAEFATARQMGFTTEEAAAKAKEISVNFDRKGLLGGTFSGLYSFFNATIQGTWNILRGLKTKRAWIAYLSIAGVYAALGVINTLLNPDDPDDDIFFSDYERQTNFLIGKIKLPVTHFFRMFFATGVNITLMGQGKKTGKQTAYDIVNFVLDEIVPASALQLHNLADYNETTNEIEFAPEKYAQAITPSYISPLTDVALNRDFMGATIHREPFMLSDGKTYKRVAMEKRNTPEIYHDIAHGLHRLSGGNPDVKTQGGSTDGRIDINANDLQHIVEGYLGGSGSFTGDIISTAINAVQGELDPTTIPVVNRAFRPYQQERAYAQQYYLLKNRVEHYEKLLKDQAKNDREAYRDETRSELYRTYNQAQGYLNNLPEPTDNGKQSKEQVKELMKLNVQWNKAQ